MIISRHKKRYDLKQRSFDLYIKYQSEQVSDQFNIQYLQFELEINIPFVSTRLKE